LQLLGPFGFSDPFSDPLTDPLTDGRSRTDRTVLRWENCKKGDFMPLPKEESYTFADVLTWDEQERVELIYGQPVLVAPPIRVHQEVNGELFGQLHEYLKGEKCKVYAAPFAVRLFEDGNDRPENVDTMVEPDISVVCDPSKLDRIGCKGAPDLIMEILAPAILM